MVSSEGSDSHRYEEQAHLIAYIAGSAKWPGQSGKNEVQIAPRAVQINKSPTVGPAALAEGGELVSGPWDRCTTHKV